MEGEKGEGDACAGGRVRPAVAAGEARRPPTTRGSVTGLGRTEGGGGAAARGEREGEGGREPPRGGRKKMKNTIPTMVETHRRRRSSLEPRRNLSIDDELEVGSMNRKPWDEALDETNAAVPSDSIDDARIESNCSLELLLELEPSRISASNFGCFGSNLRMGFRILERARREPYIYC
jgi:hypothetical protein